MIGNILWINTGAGLLDLAVIILFVSGCCMVIAGYWGFWKDTIVSLRQLERLNKERLQDQNESDKL